jgi:hypothetical protein
MRKASRTNRNVTSENIFKEAQCPVVTLEVQELLKLRLGILPLPEQPLNHKVTSCNEKS